MLEFCELAHLWMPGTVFSSLVWSLKKCDAAATEVAAYRAIFASGDYSLVWLLPFCMSLVAGLAAIGWHTLKTPYAHFFSFLKWHVPFSQTKQEAGTGSINT